MVSETRKQRILVAMTIGLILAASAVVAAEEITLTTYYPSPRGVYNELRAMNNIAIGLMGPITARLQIQGAGTTSLTSSLNVTDAFGAPLLFVRDDGRVGIGTAGPGAALDVNGQVKIRGGSPATGSVLTSDASGLATWQASVSVPLGAVMFFNLPSCPSGWSELAAARGRYVVGLPAGGTLAGANGSPLGNLEDRPVGQHTHAVSDPGHSHTTDIPSWNAMNGGSWGFLRAWSYTGSTTYPTAVTASTGISIASAGSTPGTNAPYLQLLACQKN